VLREEAAAPRSFRVLGVRVDTVQIPDVIDVIERWIQEREPCRYVAVTGMHGVSVAGRDPVFRRILEEAGLVVPDGMPLVWLGRSRGHTLERRVYGPELMIEFCRRTRGRGYRHYFYGGRAGVAQLLADSLRIANPGLSVAGAWFPPFGVPSRREREETLTRINEASPDILWVGLSTPKQERWMWESRAELRVPVLIGVGAAFDINSGRVRQAPLWMRENGLEWSWRLMQEPRRLWRRYLIDGSRFAANVALELSGLKRFD
jgi:N-acetylglucosaminyldiphosphoundecaprenol N-acetyl-beta-D-mannosaminyltransferase